MSWLGLVVHRLYVCVQFIKIDVGYPTLRYTNIPPLQIICNPVQPNCYLDECVACPGIMKFKKRLTDLVDDNCTDQIVNKHWISTNRSTLETFCVPAEKFVDIFCEKLEILRQHSNKLPFTSVRQVCIRENFWSLWTLLKITHLFSRMLLKGFIGSNNSPLCCLLC